MAATAKQRAKTITVGTTAVAFDPLADLGPNAGAMHRYLTVLNRGTVEIGVHQAGTAAIDGDDVEHVQPGASLVTDVTNLSIISTAPGTKVEIAGDAGRMR